MLEKTASKPWGTDKLYLADGQEPQVTSSMDFISLRRSLYPDVYAGNDTLSELEKFVVELPDTTRLKKANLVADDFVDESEVELTANGAEENAEVSEVASPGAFTRQQTYTQTDIWGRIPAKEPRFLVKCSVCNRKVNTLRFAPHLDKCMGLGVGSRMNSR